MESPSSRPLYPDCRATSPRPHQPAASAADAGWAVRQAVRPSRSSGAASEGGDLVADDLDAGVGLGVHLDEVA